MTKPLTHNRVDIKVILANPLLREELIEGATDFICKVEGIRRRKEDLKMTNLSSAAQAVLDAANASATNAWSDATHQRFRSGVAAALQAAADQVVPDDGVASSIERIVEKRIRTKLLAIAGELKGVTSR
jgi:hypothetical protein